MSLVANAPYPPFGEARTSKYSVVNSGPTVDVGEGEGKEEIEEGGETGGEGSEIEEIKDLCGDSVTAC